LRKRLSDKDRGLPVGPEVGRIRFKDAIQAVYDDYTLNGRKTLDNTKRRVNLHLAPFFGNPWLINITTNHVSKYSAHRLTEGAASASIRNELAILKRAFKLAFRANVVATVPYIPMPAVRNARQGFYEADHVRAILAHLPEDVRPIIAFAFITGWRTKSEVLPLQWRQVDFAAGEVRLEPGTTKNGEGRTFVLTPALKTLLETQLAVNAGLKAKGQIVPWVFPRTVTGKSPAAEKFRDQWREPFADACKAAGCPGRLAHDFRRTAVRNLVRAGVSDKVAMQMTGHKTRAIFDRYHITSGTDLREASAKLATVTDAVIDGTKTGQTPPNVTERKFAKC